jgi:hypothetical protein
MSGLEDFDLSHVDLIFHLNSVPRVCGRFETTDAMVRLEHGHVTEKFKFFTRTTFSEFVSTRSERFLEFEVGEDDSLLVPFSPHGHC